MGKYYNFALKIYHTHIPGSACIGCDHHILRCFRWRLLILLDSLWNRSNVWISPHRSSSEEVQRRRRVIYANDDMLCCQLDLQSLFNPLLGRVSSTFCYWLLIGCKTSKISSTRLQWRFCLQICRDISPGTLNMYQYV